MHQPLMMMMHEVHAGDSLFAKTELQTRNASTDLRTGREKAAPSIVKDSQSDRLGLVRQRNPAS